MCTKKVSIRNWYYLIWLILLTGFSGVLKLGDLLQGRSWNVLNMNSWIHHHHHQIFQTVECLLKKHPDFWTITLNQLCKMVIRTSEILGNLLKGLEILIIFQKMQDWLPLIWWICTQVNLSALKETLGNRSLKKIPKMAAFVLKNNISGFNNKVFQQISGTTFQVKSLPLFKHTFTWIETSKVFWTQKNSSHHCSLYTLIFFSFGLIEKKN